eukprot:CAMPEP_0172727068 /NCGR_PEP_ID=MMETSP1074-20121228/91471_1 /TAXON_ID=2916 /ORGANISM="Ceratium fusus, Strain PA161109" /LENGTH=68 /DNA_ID=CAMNT_0013554183 /DNA_START=878 /DNA_END=1084 /DNA_ORIENTATION=-
MVVGKTTCGNPDTNSRPSCGAILTSASFCTQLSVSGGTEMFFAGGRMTKELTAQAPSTMSIKITAHSE